MRISGNYGTHLGPLVAVMPITSGDVLEMGMGFFSTPYLHYHCTLHKRHLTSYDNERGWVKRFGWSDFHNHHYQSEYHDLIYVKSWDDAKIEKPWDIALMDHSPSERRIVDAKKLANLARYIILHDSNEEFNREYHYDQIYPLFKYKKIWDKDARHATILSNFNQLDHLW